MNKDLQDKITRWYQDGDKQMRYELRMYVFSLDIPYPRKCLIWEQITKRVLESKHWRPNEKPKTIVI